MQKKAFLTFVIITATIMSGYILCIADPNPPWGVDASSQKTGTINNDAAFGGTISCNVYCARNTWVTGGTTYFRTYHWAKGVSNAGQQIKFKLEYQHGDGQPENTRTENSPWEEQNTQSSTVLARTLFNPYTSMRPTAGGGGVQTDSIAVWVNP